MPRLLSYKEVDDFILKKKKSFCSWCGGAHWGIHTVQPSDVTPNFPGVRGAPELRSLFPIRLSEATPEQLTARTVMGTEFALALIVAECLDCGKMDFFNYFAVQRLIATAQSSPAGPAVPPLPGAPAVPPVPEAPAVPPVPGAPAVPPVPGAPAIPPVPGAPAVPPVPGAPAIPPVPGAPAVPPVPGAFRVPPLPGVFRHPPVPAWPRVPPVAGATQTSPQPDVPPVPPVPGVPPDRSK